jgi:Hemerythrin HHE cation binding domain
MNAVVNRMTPTITTMIRMDHSHVFALFHRYKADTPVGRKRALIANACLALETHAQLEEEIFYPALRTVLTGDQTLEKAESEHNEMRSLIAELRGRVSGDGALDASADDKFMDLMRAVMHHVADEETRLLPAAERLLADQLARLGVEMTRRRIELLRPHAGEIAATTVRSFPAGAAAGAALITAGAVALGAMLFSRSKRTGQSGWRDRW